MNAAARETACAVEDFRREVLRDLRKDSWRIRGGEMNDHLF